MHQGAALSCLFCPRPHMIGHTADPMHQLTRVLPTECSTGSRNGLSSIERVAVEREDEPPQPIRAPQLDLADSSSTEMLEACSILHSL